MDTATALEVFIGALIAIVVGVEFAPTVFQAVTGVTSNTTYTGNKNLAGAISILNILPLIFGVVVLVGAVSYLYYRRA